MERSTQASQAASFTISEKIEADCFDCLVCFASNMTVRIKIPVNSKHAASINSRVSLSRFHFNQSNNRIRFGSTAHLIGIKEWISLTKLVQVKIPCNLFLSLNDQNAKRSLSRDVLRTSTVV